MGPVATPTSLTRRVRIVRDLPARNEGANLPVVSDPVEVMERCGMVPDPWQVEYLRSEASEQIVFTNRQSGKSDLSALGALVICGTIPHSYCPVVAHREDQAGVLVAKARRWLARMQDGEDPFRLDAMPEPWSTSPRHIVFANGSELKAFPASEAAVRGPTATGPVSIDEAAKVPDEVFAALMPTRTMTETQLRLLSTPWYKLGRFFEMYTAKDHEGSDRARWRVVAPPEYGRRMGVDLAGLETSGLDDPPDVALQVCERMTWKGFLAATAGMTHQEIRREMFGIFSDEQLDSFLAHDAIQRAVRSDVAPLWAEEGEGPARNLQASESIEALF